MDLTARIGKLEKEIAKQEQKPFLMFFLIFEAEGICIGTPDKEIIEGDNKYLDRFCFEDENELQDKINNFKKKHKFQDNETLFIILEYDSLLDFPKK